ncbi:glycosyl hydrolase, partial [Parabacteroides distasonis]
MRKIIISAAVLALSATTVSADNWDQRFRNPDKAAKPWTFWYWMFGNVSDEGIRLDLEAMKHAGISGFYLMPIKSTADGKELGGASEQLSPEWWKRIDTVYRLADSLKLDMGIHFS